MRFTGLSLAALALAAVPGVPRAIPPALEAQWTAPQAPFTILGNVHYVGTKGLSAFLVTGPRGHVLIDGALPQSAAAIAANIRALGFRVEDVRVLLLNHAHFDHAGGLAELKRLSGARLLVAAGDRPSVEAGRSIGRPDLDAFPPARVDATLRDGEVVRVGTTALTAHLTPGHTPGCTSFTLRTGGRSVVFACSLTVAGLKLDAANIADFRRSFARLRTMKADVFLNFHPEFFDMAAKRARQLAGDRNAFVDPAELARQIDRAEQAFADEVKAQGLR